jgi:hypothetical protein
MCVTVETVKDADKELKGELRVVRHYNPEFNALNNQYNKVQI